MNVVARAWWYVIPAGVLAGPAFFVSPAASVFLGLLAVVILVFFRDPDRTPPPRGIVAPADGRVSVLREEGDRVRVGIFMGVHNVHVNRAPVSGEIADVTHEAGAHLPAFSKESDRNERVHIDIVDDEEAYLVELIAGSFARRITPYVEPGSTVERGERIGHIAFGSRVDVLLPPRIERTDVVTPGTRVLAGESVIADAPSTRSDQRP